MPFFIGLPGFRSKLWITDEKTGLNQGIYEWETREAAEFYANSFAIQFLKNRSVPGVISDEIIPQ